METYSHLPGYREFQRYGLGIDAVLSQIAQKIYANSHKPSWQTLKRHLFTVGIPKKLFRGIKIIAENGTDDDFEQERMFGMVGKIPIGNAFNGLVEMGFADYGACVASLHAHDTFPRFSVVVFTGAEKKDVGTVGIVREAAISHGSSAFGAPEIIVVDIDLVFTGEVFQEFRTPRNIVLQAVIHGHRQSSGTRNVGSRTSE